MRNLRWKRTAPYWYEAAAAGVIYIVGPDRPSGYFVECRRANDLRNSEILARGVVPTANLKRLTASANRLILAPDERSLQVDLVRLDRNIPAAGFVASREPCPSTSTQRAAAQIPKAVGVR